MRRAVLYNSKTKASGGFSGGGSGVASRVPGARRRSSIIDRPSLGEDDMLAGSRGSLPRNSNILTRLRRKRHSVGETSFPVGPRRILSRQQQDEYRGGWIAWIFGGEDRSGRGDGQGGGSSDVLIHPYSRFAQLWESTSGVLLLYTAAVTPLLISFYNEQQGYCGRAPTIELDIAVDLFFVLEIFVHFYTGQVVRGSIQMNFKSVARIYLVGDFWRDLLSSSPIAWVEFFLVPGEITCSDVNAGDQENMRFVRSLRFIRMIKLLRLLKVLKIFNVMRDLLRMRPASVRLIKAGFFVFLIAHIGGCFWWFIKVQTTTSAELQEFRDAKGILFDVTSTYLASVYFIMATLCTVGYGDIFAVGNAERFFALFMMLMGASVFAIIVSNMSALASNMQSRENQVLEEMENVVDFMRSNGISVTLEKLVQDFYLFRCRQKTAFTSRLEVLSELPDGLHRSIMMELNRNLLSAVWVFDKMGQKEIESAVEMFDVQLATPGEVIVDDECTPDCIYIIITGTVNLQVYNNRAYTDVDSLSKGEVFGEVGVILDKPCPYRAIACDYVELYKLSREHLEMLNEMSPPMQERLEDGARERMEEFQTLQAGENSVADRWQRITLLVMRRNKRENMTNLDRAKDRLYQYSVASVRPRMESLESTRSGGSGSEKRAASAGHTYGGVSAVSDGDSPQRSASAENASSRRRRADSPYRGRITRTLSRTPSVANPHRAHMPKSLNNPIALAPPPRFCSGQDSTTREQVSARLRALAEMIPVETGGVLVQCACGRCSDRKCIVSRWQKLSDDHALAEDRGGCESCSHQRGAKSASVHNPTHNARLLQKELQSILELLDTPAQEDSEHGGGVSDLEADASLRSATSSRHVQIRAEEILPDIPQMPEQNVLPDAAHFSTANTPLSAPLSAHFNTNGSDHSHVRRDLQTPKPDATRPIDAGMGSVWGAAQGAALAQKGRADERGSANIVRTHVDLFQTRAQSSGDSEVTHPSCSSGQFGVHAPTHPAIVQIDGLDVGTAEVEVHVGHREMVLMANADADSAEQTPGSSAGPRPNLPLLATIHSTAQPTIEGEIGHVQAY